MSPPAVAARPVAGFHAPPLEIAAYRAARYFAIGILTGEPHFEIVGHARAEAHVAGAELHHAVRQRQAPQNLLGSGRHALELVARRLGAGDRYELDLAE